MSQWRARELERELEQRRQEATKLVAVIEEAGEREAELAGRAAELSAEADALGATLWRIRDEARSRPTLSYGESPYSATAEAIAGDKTAAQARYDRAQQRIDEHAPVLLAAVAAHARQERHRQGLECTLAILTSQTIPELEMQLAAELPPPSGGEDDPPAAPRSRLAAIAAQWHL
jgi:hypothetical protein